MMSARFAHDPVFGDVALALRPRSGAGPPRSTGESIEVEFDARGLAPGERAALSQLSLAQLCAGDEALSPASGNRARRSRISCRRSSLADLEPRTEGVAALLAADANARRMPEPVRLMGVVNVTPDSFSDAGRFLDPERAVEHGLRLVDAGASFLDVGGESTRPGAEPVDPQTEIRRVVPVVEGLARRTSIPISIDTTKAAVAEAAFAAGATIVNDISAGTFDPRLLEVVAARRAGFIAMHMQGRPRDMQVDPTYEDVLTEVVEFLRGRVRACLETGIERAQIWIDPGIGFGKRLEHNLELIAHLGQLRSLGQVVCLGVSRKSFIAAVEARARDLKLDPDPGQRTGGTAAALTIGVWNGAEILRVHDVRTMMQAALVAEALAFRNRREVRG
jgi:dihydropteroate synthase